MTRRKKREFNKERHEQDMNKEAFKFPLDIDGTDSSDDGAIQPLDTPPAYVRRPQRETKYKTHKPSVKRPTRMTISKARQVPSAVYGLNKPKRSDRDEREIYLEKFKNYNSVIVDKIVEERMQREKRKDKQKQKEQQKRAELAALKKKRDAQKANGEIVKAKAEPKNKQHDTLSVLGSKQNKLREKQQAATGKRIGPNVTQPGVSILGTAQAADYKAPDNNLAKQIDDAFDKLNVEGRVTGYTSNGVIGRYEVKLNRAFRVSNIPRLNTALKAELGLDELRIMSPLIGTSNIGLEVPLAEVRPITFRTLFEASSLKLRKPDYKFAVGKTVDDKIFSYELSKAGHILIYGNQPNYDTNVIDNIMLSLLMNQSAHELKVAVAAADDTYDDYLDVPHSFGRRMAPDDPETMKIFLTELNERSVQFRRAHVRNIQSYNSRVKFESKKATLVIIIDDLAAIIENKNPEPLRGLVHILKQGKPLGIHVIANNMNTDQNIRYELLQLLQTKIAFYDAENKAVSGTDELTQGNDALAVIPTSNKPNRISVGTVNKNVRQSVFDHIKHNNR
jgi:DNA segregation ATPase FtsK/SpoIIIE, S-DNA-T family